MTPEESLVSKKILEDSGLREECAKTPPIIFSDISALAEMGITYSVSESAKADMPCKRAKRQ